MRRLRGHGLAALALAGLACAAAPTLQAGAGLDSTELYWVADGDNGTQAAFAPHVTLGSGGTAAALLNTTTAAATAAECSASCRALLQCAWWNWCGDQVRAVRGSHLVRSNPRRAGRRACHLNNPWTPSGALAARLWRRRSAAQLSAAGQRLHPGASGDWPRRCSRARRRCATQLPPWQAARARSRCGLLLPRLLPSSPPVRGAGFPIRITPLEVPGYVTRVALGVQGNDLLECGGGEELALPSVCAFHSALDAASACGSLKECRAVTVYVNGEEAFFFFSSWPCDVHAVVWQAGPALPSHLSSGAGTDGCSSEPVALLKRSSSSPANAFVAPSVYTLDFVDYQLVRSPGITFFLSFFLSFSPATAAQLQLGAHLGEGQGAWARSCSPPNDAARDAERHVLVC